MNALKKIGLVVAVALFGPLLVLSTSSLAFAKTVGNQTYVENTIKKAKLYDAISTLIIDKAEGQGEQQVIIHEALQEAISPAAVEKTLAPILSSTYGWLDGKTDAPKFSVDVSNFKATFSASLQQKLQAKTASLPTCTRANMPATTDVYSLTCIPPGTNVTAEINDAVSSVTQSADVFSDQAVSGDQKLDTNEVKQLGVNAPTNNPSPWIAKGYQLLKNGLPFFALGALLSLVGIIFLSKTKLRGLRKTGTILLLNGVVLLIIGGGLQFVLSSLVPTTSVGTTDAPINAIEAAAKIIIKDNANILRNFGIVFSALGLAGVITSSVLISKREKPTGDTPKDTPSPPENKISDEKPEIPAPEEPKTS